MLGNINLKSVFFSALYTYNIVGVISVCKSTPLGHLRPCILQDNREAKLSLKHILNTHLWGVIAHIFLGNVFLFFIFIATISHFLAFLFRSPCALTKAVWRMFLALTYGFLLCPDTVVVLVTALSSQCSATFDATFIYVFHCRRWNLGLTHVIQVLCYPAPTKASYTQGLFLPGCCLIYFVTKAFLLESSFMYSTDLS